jgi:hypothetical protein
MIVLVVLFSRRFYRWGKRRYYFQQARVGRGSGRMGKHLAARPHVKPTTPNGQQLALDFSSRDSATPLPTTREHGPTITAVVVSNGNVLSYAYIALKKKQQERLSAVQKLLRHAKSLSW